MTASSINIMREYEHPSTPPDGATIPSTHGVTHATSLSTTSKSAPAIYTKACEIKRKNFAYKKPVYIYNLDSREHQLSQQQQHVVQQQSSCCGSCQYNDVAERTVEDVTQILSCYPSLHNRSVLLESTRVHKF